MKMKRKLEVLFLCTGNSCRSQMAEGLARHFKSDFLIPYSAGVETHGMNESAILVMQEIGIDIRAQKSQHSDEFAKHRFDYVITVCDRAAESCPTFANADKVVIQRFDDPPALAKNETDPQKALDHYRRVRDEIKNYIESLPEILKLN